MVYISLFILHSAPSNVTNLRATNISSSSVFVSWGKPTSPNGIIQNYEVLVQLHSNCVQKIKLKCSHCMRKHKDDSAHLKEDPDQVCFINFILFTSVRSI